VSAPASSPFKAVISDFGGVLTNPLMEAFASLQQESGIDAETIGKAMFALTEARGGQNPLFELETGRMTEPDFVTLLEGALAEELGREVSLHEFSATYWAGLHANDAMIGLMIRLRHLGFRMALLTNNVREWEPRWRAMLPVDEIFEVVVDSGFVGVRKPDPEIYAITLERLGLTGTDCVFVDDIEINCNAATELGMRAVHFVDTERAIAEIEAALGLSG
jgi:putative hydrolase of the HAD superfamily